MSIYFGQDPVRAEIAELVAKLQAGDVIDAGYETLRVDLKEEAGRRSSSGDIQPGASENEVAAQQLAQEAACMANTPGGGGLIVGVASDGELVGTDLDAEWLRHRIYELTDRGHTADVFEVMVRNTRLLVIISPPAIEPIRWRKKIYWRVGANCVEVDAATWHSKKMATLRYDWSGDNSGIKMEQVRAQALEVARDFLRAAGDGTAEELAEASNEQMLRRLKAVGRDGYLTNAGALVFVGRRAPCLDYVHRDYAGADSTVRVNRAGRSLLEELHEVFLAMEVRIGTRHLQSGLVRGQMRELPLLAAREAIVNGLAHREWGVDDPTWVEHIGLTLKVTSPGGFYGGVTESNIITHPSQSRNTALTQLLADLRIAEREGIGVDRMVREMVRMGYSRPVIREIDGPKSKPFSSEKSSMKLG